MLKVPIGGLMKIIIFIRLLGILVPQLGYIHPDEFFQGPEIAGESLGYKIFKAWEYKGANPIRSAVFPLIISKTIYVPLKLISEAYSFAIPPCLLLALPRLFMFLFSLAHDFCLLKICSLLHLDPHPVIVIYGTSFVSFIFMIRTFSNCLEAGLFTILLYLTLSSQKEMISNLKMLVMGSIIALGVFVRPTFLLFAFVPVFFWIFTKGFQENTDWLFRALKLAACFLTTSLSLVWLDTDYFRRNLGFSATDSFIVTPLNFFLYNTDTSNLEKHGLHPRYLHFLVNLPLMYGVLAIVAVYQSIKHLPQIHEAPTSDLILALSWFLPLLGLSIFPHQEPRFLLPLLVPLVLLYASFVYENKYLCALWVLGNTVCALVFGSFHQGGLIPFLLENNHFRGKGHTTIFFSHTYMIPLHLLQNNGTTLEVHDLGNNPIDPIPGRYCKEHCLIVLPGSAAFSDESLSMWRAQGKKMNIIRSYFPHLSIENLPNLEKVCSIWDNTCSTWNTLIFQMSLHVYSIN